MIDDNTGWSIYSTYSNKTMQLDYAAIRSLQQLYSRNTQEGHGFRMPK